jgi:uncharacterized SAM-binding protein YcdF (DUF218 family)
LNSVEFLFLMRKVATALVLPPVGPLLLMILGAFIGARRPRWGQRIFFLGVFVTVVLAMPAVADMLQWSFEDRFPPIGRLSAQPDEAIVILGAGRNLGAVEYGGETVSAMTLERLRYGARLAKQSGLPVLVSGGAPGGGTKSEGELMADTLRSDFGVTVRWAETRSNTTSENAALSIPILQADGIKRVVLVTDVINMQRARYDFTERGMPVNAAPMGFRYFHTFSALSFVPTAQGYERSTYVLHEWLGLLWSRTEDRPYG